MGYALAMDFGTTASMAAIFDDGGNRADPVRLGDDDRMPSAVLVAEDGIVVAGPEVLHEGPLQPHRIVRTPKRELGQGPVLVGGATLVRDVDLVAPTLRYMHEEAVRLRNGEPCPIVLTHPIAWGDTRLSALRSAAALAGLESIELVSEPIAAATALTRRDDVAGRVPEGARVAVFDFGGGTLDIALLTRVTSGFERFGMPGGNERIGGGDVDDSLMTFLLSKLPDTDREFLIEPESSDALVAWEKTAYQFRLDVRKGKEQLARRKDWKIPLQSPPASVDHVLLTEADLRASVQRIVKSACDCLARTLAENQVAPHELAAIFLVGGSSRLAVVQRMLYNRLNVEVAHWDNPKALVAFGAAETARLAHSRPSTTDDRDDGSRDTRRGAPPAEPTLAAPTGDAVAAGREGRFDAERDRLASTIPTDGQPTGEGATPVWTVPPTAGAAPGPQRRGQPVTVNWPDAEVLARLPSVHADEDTVETVLGVAFSPDGLCLARAITSGELLVHRLVDGEVSCEPSTRRPPPPSPTTPTAR